jgi:hypothetical protein
MREVTAEYARRYAEAVAGVDAELRPILAPMIGKTVKAIGFGLGGLHLIGSTDGTAIQLWGSDDGLDVEWGKA